MTIAPQSITVAYLYTSNVERCLDWYRDHLGLPASGRDDYGAYLDSPGARIRVTMLPDFQPGEHPVVGWQVPDLAAVGSALRNKGVSFTLYPGMGQDADGIWTSPDGKDRLAWLSDADGNVLMLTESRSS